MVHDRRSHREDDLRAIAEQIEVWLDQGLYDLGRVGWLVSQMEPHDLMALFQHAKNLEVKDTIRTALSTHGLTPEEGVVQTEEEVEVIFDFS